MTKKAALTKKQPFLSAIRKNEPIKYRRNYLDFSRLLYNFFAPKATPAAMSKLKPPSIGISNTGGGGGGWQKTSCTKPGAIINIVNNTKNITNFFIVFFILVFWIISLQI